LFFLFLIMGQFLMQALDDVGLDLACFDDLGLRHYYEYS